MTVLELSHVTKHFGSVAAVEDVSFAVPPNAVFGLIGKNGAGKTTAMKMILGFLKADAGTIFVCGEKVVFGEGKTNRHIGYLPDVPSFYGYMTPKEYLGFCGKISGMSKEEIHKRSELLLPLTGLDGINRRIKGFSRGMLQRLGIAQALLHSPSLLICDEPTSALDPVGRKEILEILLLAKADTTVIFSTHILADVERISDSIGILNQGKLVLSGALSKLKELGRKDMVRVEFAGEAGVPSLAEKIAKLPGIDTVVVKGSVLEIGMNAFAKVPEGLWMEILKARLPLRKYEVLEPSLENLFLEAVK